MTNSMTADVPEAHGSLLITPGRQPAARVLPRNCTARIPTFEHQSIAAAERFANFEHQFKLRRRTLRCPGGTSGHPGNCPVSASGCGDAVGRPASPWPSRGTETSMLAVGGGPQTPPVRDNERSSAERARFHAPFTASRTPGRRDRQRNTRRTGGVRCPAPARCPAGTGD